MLVAPTVNLATAFLAGAVLVATLDYYGVAHAQPPAPPGQAQAASGTITVLVDGKPIATGGVINLKSGSGVLATATPNPAINGTDIEFDSNTVFLATLGQVQSILAFCHSTNGTAQLTCNLPSRALPAYQQGQVFLLLSDTSCTSCNLNIDNLGVKGIKDANDNDAPITKLIPKWVFYDGVVFRLI